MDIRAVAEEIYQYTSGYPYLVSALCKIMDEKLAENGGFADLRDIWTKKGIVKAVEMILKSKNPEKFVEAHGRKLFLLYLKPIINGTGNYYLESQTRDAKRTDVIVDYLGEQFIVELKIWHGNEYNERGERQLAEYLEYYHQKRGYMISFNFSRKKETGVKEIVVGDKVLVEAVV